MHAQTLPRYRCGNSLVVFEICKKEEEMKYLLQVMEGLAARLAAILNVDVDLEESSLHNQIIKKSWKLNDVYSYSMDEDQKMDVFYLNDEVGSRIYHSGNDF